MNGIVVAEVRRSGRVVKGFSARGWGWLVPELLPPRELRKFWTRAEASWGCELTRRDERVSLPFSERRRDVCG